MNFNQPENVVMLATYSYWLLLVGVHVALAVAVFRDAEGLMRAPGRRLWLLNSGFWALAALVGGIVTAGIYWAVHHSSLRSPEAPAEIQSSTKTKP